MTLISMCMLPLIAILTISEAIVTSNVNSDLKLGLCDLSNPCPHASLHCYKLGFDKISKEF